MGNGEEGGGGGGEGVLVGDQFSGMRQAWDGRDGQSWLWLVQSAVPRRRESFQVSRQAALTGVLNTVMGSQEEVQAGGSLKGSLMAGNIVSGLGSGS